LAAPWGEIDRLKAETAPTAASDGPRPFPRGLQHGTRRPGLETSRPPLSGRPIEGVGQGEEPQAPGNGAREGHVLMIGRQRDLWRSCLVSPEQRRESRHSETAALGRLCCKSLLVSPIAKFPGRGGGDRILMWGTTSFCDELTDDIGGAFEATSIDGCRLFCHLAEILPHGVLGVLQQNQV